MTEQIAYWNRVAEDKIFTHPLNTDWLQKHVPLSSAVLDLGCGYGRNCNEMKQLGYQDIIGIDNAEKMILRGKRLYPNLDLRVMRSSPTDFDDKSFDLILLFAVLTCLVDNHDQNALMAEVSRLLRPGGMLYLSDFPVQSDRRNRNRYEKYRHRFANYGTFALPEGVVVRHLERDRIQSLLEGFHSLETANIPIKTMNNHSAEAFQYLGRKSVSK